MIEHDDIPTTDAEDVSDRDSQLLESIVDACPGRPDECTIFPAGATEMDLLTTWISATEGSYVNLDAMR